MRPHTSLDFTRNNTLDAFNDFSSDPFHTPKQNKIIENTLGELINLFNFLVVY